MGLGGVKSADRGIRPGLGPSTNVRPTASGETGGMSKTPHTERPRSSLRQTSAGARVECETRINAPREFIWELIQEPTRRIEWDARLTNCQLKTPRPLGA